MQNNFLRTLPMISSIAVTLVLCGCNSGGGISSSQSNQVNNTPTTTPKNKLSENLYTLSSQKLTSTEYAQRLLSMNSADAQRIGNYYAKIKPAQTIYESQEVIDCIPFDQQRGIIDLSEEQKQLANQYNEKHYQQTLAKLNEQSQNGILQQNHGTEICSGELIPQARPVLDPKTLQENTNSTVSNGSISNGTIYNWAERLPSQNNNNSYIDTGDIFTRQPIPGTQSSYVYHDSWIGAPVQNCSVAGCLILSQIWVVGSGNTLELGSWSYSGSTYSLFARSVRNNEGYGSNEAPFIQWSGTPYPANVFNSGDGSDDLHYIITNKGAGDPMCAGDPAGCYAFMVGHSDHGRSNTSLFEMGYFSKSNYNQQNFNMFATGVEIHQLSGETVSFGNGVFEQRMGLNYGDKSTVPYGTDLSEQYYGNPTPNNLQFTYEPDYYGTPMVMAITGSISR